MSKGQTLFQHKLRILPYSTYITSAKPFLLFIKNTKPSTNGRMEQINPTKKRRPKANVEAKLAKTAKAQRLNKR